MSGSSEDERIEDLQYKGLRVIQSGKGFRFGTDSVLLAGFANLSPREKAIDLGAGCGVISILLQARTGAELTAVEIDPAACSLARRSIEMNGQPIEVVEADMRGLHAILGTGRFDAAVCNPPYYPAGGGKLSQKGEGELTGAATHDITCTLGDVAAAAAKLLRFGGRLYLCCPASRLAEAFSALSPQKLEPKRLRMVASTPEKAPYLALIEAKKGGAPGLIVEKQLTVHDEDGFYTEEVDRIYHRTTE